MDSDGVIVGKEVTGGMKSKMAMGERIDHARVKEVSGAGDQVPRVDASELDLHIELLLSHVHGEIGFDGVFEGEQVSILLDSGGGAT